jgi:long-chain acyl-CoA synthetase
MVAVVAGSDIKEAELLTFCAGFLEPRKVPSRIAVAAELPKGRSGKVIISEARQLLEQAQGAPASAAAKTGDIEMRLLDLAANCFKVDRARLSLSSTPHDITGWDSLAHMEFVVALETAFGKRLSARDVVALDRLDKALALITG